MILEQCKGVYCVDLGESFQTHVYLQNLASIQPRTSPPKLGRGVSGGRHAAARAGNARDLGARQAVSNDSLRVEEDHGRALGEAQKTVRA